MKVKMIFMLFLLVLLGLETTVTVANSIGICYGQVANNLPSPKEVIDLYKRYGIGRMRIYNPNQETLQALRGSNIELVIGVPNEDIQSIANDVSLAINWVQKNILTYSQNVNFKYIVVGNEIDPSNDPTSQFVLPAMQNIYTSLASSNLQNQVKVSTAIQMGLLGSSFPPSKGAFSSSSSSYITPIVKFLVGNDAPLLANVYTYFSYISEPNQIDISYALLNSRTFIVKDGEYVYHNLFDATLGALYSALEKVGGTNLEVVVSESGWPSSGGVAATVENSQIYYQNLIKHVSSGTTKRPGRPLEIYLFAMFDENHKGPTETEQHFGLFTPNKQIKYQINFKASNSESSSASSLGRGGEIFSFGLPLIIGLLYLINCMMRSVMFSS